MFSTIFNVKAIVERLKGNYGLNVYHRFNNAINGNVRGMTVEMISEIEEIVKDGNKEMLNRLNKMKKDVANLSQKQAA